jgi:hypothetical protein
MLLHLHAAAIAQPAPRYKVVDTTEFARVVDINAAGTVLVDRGSTTLLWTESSSITFGQSDFTPTTSLAAFGWPSSGCSLDSITFEPRRLMNNNSVYGVLRGRNMCITNPPVGVEGGTNGQFLARRRGLELSQSAYEILDELGETSANGILIRGGPEQFSIQDVANGHLVAHYRNRCNNVGPGDNCDQSVFPQPQTGTSLRTYSLTSASSSQVLLGWNELSSCEEPFAPPCDSLGVNPLLRAFSYDYYESGSPVTEASGCGFRFNGLFSSFILTANGNLLRSRQIDCEPADGSAPEAWLRGLFSVSTSTLAETLKGQIGIPTTFASGKPYLWREGSSSVSSMAYRIAHMNASGDTYALATSVQTTNSTLSPLDDATAGTNQWVKFNSNGEPTVLGAGGDIAALSDSRDFYRLENLGLPTGLRLIRYNPTNATMSKTILNNSSGTIPATVICNSFNGQSITVIGMSDGSLATNNLGDLIVTVNTNAGTDALVMYVASTDQFYPLVITGQQWDATRTVSGFSPGGVAPIIGEGGSPGSGNNGRAQRINDARQVLVKLTLSDASTVVARIDFNASDYCNGCVPPTNNDIDFNNNGVFPEDQDVIDFFDVIAGGECPVCDDIDINNNGVFPEDADVVCFFTLLAGGTCDGVCN